MSSPTAAIVRPATENSEIIATLATAVAMVVRVLSTAQLATLGSSMIQEMRPSARFDAQTPTGKGPYQCEVALLKLDDTVSPDHYLATIRLTIIEGGYFNLVPTNQYLLVESLRTWFRRVYDNQVQDGQLTVKATVPRRWFNRPPAE